MRPRRSDLLLLGGLVAFPLIFIVSATWLGSKERVRYALDPLPPLGAAETELVSALGILTPRYPSGIAWCDADTKGRADMEARVADGGLEAAVLRLLQGRPEEAVEAARRGLSTRLDDGDLHLILGIGLEQMGDQEAAATAYLRAEGALSDDVDVLFRIACLHLSGRRYRDARRYAERLVLKAPRYPEVQRVLGDSCLGAHDLGRAKRAFNDLLQLRPGDVVAQQRVKFLDGTR